MVELKPEEKKFVAEFLVSCNIADAGRRAMPKHKNPENLAAYMIRRPHVRKAIDDELSKFREKKGIDAENVIQAIADMAFFDPGEIAAYNPKGPDDLLAMPREVRAAIKGWRWDKSGNFEIHFADRAKALDQLARHLALYNDTLSVDIGEDLAARIRRAKERMQINIPGGDAPTHGTVQ